MKLINTYKQHDITWFNCKHLFELTGDYSYAHKAYPESALMSWIMEPHLNINIREPYEDN